MDVPSSKFRQNNNKLGIDYQTPLKGDNDLRDGTKKLSAKAQIDDLDDELGENLCDLELENDEYEKWLQSTIGTQEENGTTQGQVNLLPTGNIITEQSLGDDSSNLGQSSRTSAEKEDEEVLGSKHDGGPAPVHGGTPDSTSIPSSLGPNKRAERDGVLSKRGKSKEDVDDSQWYTLLNSQLEQRRRILAHLDRQLEREAVQVKAQKLEFNRQWEKVVNKQKTLSDVMKKFNELQTECREKQRLANQVFQAEKAETDIYNQQIKVDQKKLKCLSKLLEDCQERHERVRAFSDFLQDVKEESKGQFKTIRQVINRAHILLLTRDKLIDWEWQNQRDVILASQELYQTKQIRTTKNLLQANFLTEFRKYHTARENELLMLGEQMDLVKAAAANQVMTAGRIELCINNLYIEMCKQVGITPMITFPWDPEAQLKGIQVCMKELMKLSQRIRQHEASSSANAAISLEDSKAERIKHLKGKKSSGKNI